MVYHRPRTLEVPGSVLGSLHVSVICKAQKKVETDRLAYYTHFLTLEKTFITLFWALFGLSNHEGVELPSYPGKD